MKIRNIKILIVVLALFTAATALADSSDSVAPSTGEATARQAEYEELSQELNLLQAGLPGKKKDLARLRRKWVSVKGRMPSAEELEDFEEKRAEGEVAIEDNPYVNKNPLSSPGIYRAAYYKKLDEIKRDEKRIAVLQDQIEALNR